MMRPFKRMNLDDKDGENIKLTETATSTSTNNVNACLSSPRLVDIHDVDCYHRRDWILTAYRSSCSAKECIASLFQYHNETINIWTHLVGTLIVIGVCGYILNDDKYFHTTAIEAICLAFFFISCFLCLAFSTVYHLFNCHSEHVHACLLRLDLTGISVMIAGGYFPGIYYGFKCLPVFLALYLIISVCILLSSLYVSLSSKVSSSTRTMVLVFVVTFGLVPSTHWAIIAPSVARTAIMIPLAAMFISYGIGFVFYFTKWPEKSFPGSVDCFGSSHQFWHVFVVIALLFWIRGIDQSKTMEIKYGCSLF